MRSNQSWLERALGWTLLCVALAVGSASAVAAAVVTLDHFALAKGDAVFWDGPRDLDGDLLRPPGCEEQICVEYELELLEAAPRLRVALDMPDDIDLGAGLLNPPAEPTDNGDAFILTLIDPTGAERASGSPRYSIELAVREPMVGLWKARVEVFPTTTDSTFRMRAKLEEELPNTGGTHGPAVTVIQAPDPDLQGDQIFGSEFTGLTGGTRPLADFGPGGLGPLPAVLADDRFGCLFATGLAMTQGGKRWIAVAESGERLPDEPTPTCPDYQLKISSAQAAGADAIVVVGSAGLPADFGTGTGENGEIPGILIPHDQGERLIAAMQVDPADPEDVEVGLGLISTASSNKLLMPNLRLTPPFEFVAGADFKAGVAPTGCLARELLPREDGGDGARQCLRFSFGPENIGGPLELRVGVPGYSTPTGGTVIQRIYRSDGTVAEEREAGTYEFHPEHLHFHVDHYANSELYRVTDLEAGTLELAGPGQKQGFCTADYAIARWHRFANDPTNDPGPGEPGTCTAVGGASTGGLGGSPLDEAVIALSPGWADIYAYYLEGNYVEFGDNPSGFYVVRVLGNDDDSMHETTSADNHSYALIEVVRDALTGAVHVERVVERGYGTDPWDPNRKVATDIRNDSVSE